MADFLRRIGTGANNYVIIPIIKAGSDDFATSSDWTPATGDVKLSKEGGTADNIGTLPTYITNVGWKFVFTDAELSTRYVNVNIVDSATKAIKDQHFTISTYGSTSAGLQFATMGGTSELLMVDLARIDASIPAMAGIKNLGLNAVGADNKVLLSSSAQTGVTIPTVTNLTNAPTAGDFTATMKSSLNASTPASVTGAVGSVTAAVTVGTNNDKTGYSILAADKNTLVDLIWDELQSGHVTAGTFGKYLDGDKTGYALSVTDKNTLVDLIWDELQAGHTTAATFGRYLDAQVSLIKAVTDLIPNGGAMTTISNNVTAIYNKLPAGTISDFDNGVESVIVGTNNDKTGYALTTAEKNTIVDLVWDELQSGHTTAGTFGKFLDAQVSLAGTSLTSQQIRDSLKLAPSGGAPAAGSIDDHLDNINGDTDAIVLKLPSGNISDFDNGVDSVIVGTNNDKTGYEISGTKNTLDDLNDISVSDVNDTISNNEDIVSIASNVSSIYGKLPSKTHLTGTDNSTGNVELDDATGALPAGAFVNIPDVDLNANQSGVTIGTVNALGTQAKADVHTEIDAVVNIEDQSELSAGTPPTIESLGKSITRIRMALVNQGIQTEDYKTFHNSSNTPIWKKEISSRDPYIEKKGVAA